MMSRIKEKVRPTFFTLVRNGLLNVISGINPIIPFYHIICEGEVPHIKHLYRARSIKEFEEDLDLFLKRYSPITLLELITCVAEERPLTAKCFMLTFDDGLREFYDIAVPVLERKGVPATLFICSAFLDNKVLSYDHKKSLLQEHIRQKDIKISPREIKELFEGPMGNHTDLQTALQGVGYQSRGVLDALAEKVELNWNSYLSEHKPYITSEQVHDLLQRGFTVGAHSIDHPPYASLSLKEQIRQTKQSIEFIIEKFSLTYRAFAFPYNDQGISREYFDTLFDEGICDVSFGSSGRLDKTLKRHFHRLWMENRSMSASEIIRRDHAKRLLRMTFG